MSKTLLAAIFLTAVCASSSAWAVVAAPIDVPEPGLFGVVAIGAAALLVSARIRGKK